MSNRFTVYVAGVAALITVMLWAMPIWAGLPIPNEELVAVLGGCSNKYSDKLRLCWSDLDCAQPPCFPIINDTCWGTEERAQEVWWCYSDPNGIYRSYDLWPCGTSKPCHCYITDVPTLTTECSSHIDEEPVYKSQYPRCWLW